MSYVEFDYLAKVHRPLIAIVYATNGDIRTQIGQIDTGLRGDGARLFLSLPGIKESYYESAYAAAGAAIPEVNSWIDRMGLAHKPTD